MIVAGQFTELCAGNVGGKKSPRGDVNGGIVRPVQDLPSFRE